MDEFLFQLSSLLRGQNWEWRTFLKIMMIMWSNWLGVYLSNWLILIGQ